MKELTVISGKGGTGKTTIMAAFAALAENAVLADCDVDAADLHLLLAPEVLETQDFMGLQLAVKDPEKCTMCGLCHEKCLFDAIDEDNNIRAAKCEGCGVCGYVCPEDAIHLTDRVSGNAYISNTRFGPMAHAHLNAAEEASGKLVAMVRNNAKELAGKHGRDLVIIDGPPGIGCPVIAAIAGVDLVLVVTEPTISGAHDLERVLGVAKHFNIPAVVCINKFDINTGMSLSIEQMCGEMGVDVVGKLPYDEIATKAMIQEKTVVEFSEGEFTAEIKKIWARVLDGLS
jgi:MinD superfamily P-loop ATPase